MKKNYIAITFLTLMAFMPFAGNAQTTFQKVYTSAYDMDGLDVIPAQGGGYIITGMTTNDIIDDMDIHIIKTNSTGEIEWTKTYGGDKPEYSFGILKATDNSGYYIIGYSRSYGFAGADSDTWLIKIGNDGAKLWDKLYGTWGNDQGKEIISTSDGNYMLVGQSNSATMPDYQAFLIKIEPDGDIIWDKYYGGSSAVELGNSVKQTPDGGYIMLGQTFSYGAGNGDAYLVKTDADGVKEWEETYGGTQNDEGIFITANNDGTYTFCVRDSSTAGTDVDVQIIKTQADGTEIWNKNYGGNRKDTDKMIQPTSDGGYVVAAISRSFSFSQLPDMWILKLDSNGDTLWTRSYGGQDNEHCYSVRQTSDGGYIAVGKAESFSVENGIMFLKLNSNGQMGPSAIVEFSQNSSFEVYPNPTDGILNIDFQNFKEQNSTIKISNVLGQEVFSHVLDHSATNNMTKAVDLKGNEHGIYFLTVQSAGNSITTKLILK